jgi:hypothetical protein
MKKYVYALGAATLMSGCILPEGVTEEDLLSFDAAVSSIGCDLATEADYMPVELQTGMPREKLITVAQYKVEQKEAVALSNGGVRLVTGSCAPKVDAAPVATSGT